MEQAGVQLIAQGAAAYMSDMKSATGATNTFVDSTEKGAGVVGRAGDMMGSAIKGVATIAAGVGVAGFVALGKAIFDGLGDARESARLNAATEQTILSMGNAAGVSAQHVADMAAALSDASGKSLFGDDQIQQSENLLLTFGNIKGETFDLATALTVDLAQALGGAPADQAMMLGKALNDPVKGITALGRAGLTFSEDQQAAIKAMVDTGDVAGAQALIIAELNKQVGGQAAAAAEAAGGIEQFKARMGETFETIATQLLPILNEFGDWLNSPEVTASIDELAAALIAAFGWAADNIPPTIKAIVDGVQDVVRWFDTASATSNDLGGAVNDLSGIWDHLIEVVGNVMDGYKAIAEAVLPVVQQFVADHGAEIEAFFKATWDSIIEIVNLALDLYNAIVPPVLNAIAGFIAAHGDEIQKVLTGVWNAVTSIITGALETIKGVISLVLHIIQGDWEAAWEDVKKIGQAQWDAIKGFASGFLDAIAGIFNTTLADILQTWQNNWDMALDIVTKINWVDAGASVVEGIISGISSMASELFATLQEMAQDAYDKFYAAIKGGSPAKEFIPAGQSIVQGIMQGMVDSWPALLDSVSEMSDELIESVRDIGGQINSAVADSFGATASIDRQVAKNLDSFKDVLPAYQQYTTGALKQAQQEAEAFLDPAEGAKFFQMRSKQILEYAKLQKDLSETQNAEDRARIEAQMLLINRAQTAEISQFNANQAAQGNPMQGLIDQIGLLFNNPEKARLEKELADAKTDAERQRIQAQLNQASLPVNDTGIGHDLMLFLQQLEHWISPRAQAYANPPQMQYAPAGGGATTTTTNVNMPIYTNNSPAALQQSWAVLQASMP